MSDLARLILARGQQQADWQREKYDRLGNAVANLGSTIGGAIEQRKEEKALRAQSQALLQLMQNPQATPEQYFQVAGPKGLEYYKGVQNFHAAKMEVEKGQIQEARQRFPTIYRTFMAATDPALKEVLYPEMRQLGIASGEIPDDPRIAPEQYTPEIEPMLQNYGKARFPVEKKYEKVGDALLDVSGAKPTVAYQAPPEPEKPLTLEQQYAKAFASGDQAQMAAIRGAMGSAAAATRAPKEVPAAAEFELNPEGVVLSSYGTKDKNEVRRQARERGIPVFDNATTQAKGVALAGIAADAQELNGLLADPEVQASIGPIAGRWTGFKGSVASLPPKVRRAMQLLTSLSDSELRKRSGAQVHEKEMQRILQFATDPNKPLDHNTIAVGGILKSAGRDYRALSGQSPHGGEEEPQLLSSHGSYLSTDPDAGEPVN